MPTGGSLHLLQSFFSRLNRQNWIYSNCKKMNKKQRTELKSGAVQYSVDKFVVDQTFVLRSNPAEILDGKMASIEAVD
jgi:hypothetical protein